MGFLDSGIGEGLNQATGTIAKTALNLAELQQQARHMRALEANDTQRLAMQKTHYDSLNQEREIEMRQKEVALAKAQEDIKPVDADNFLSSKGFTAGQIKYVKDVAAKSGLIEQDGNYSYVPKKAGAEFLGKFIADPEHNVNLGRIGMQEIDAQRAQIKQALADPKLKPEDMQKLKLQDAELANKRTDLFHRTKLSQQEFDAKHKLDKATEHTLSPEMKSLIDIYGQDEVNKMTPDQKIANIRRIKQSTKSDSDNKPTDFDKEYNDYIALFKQHKREGKYKDPNQRPFTRGEYRAYMKNADIKNVGDDNEIADNDPFKIRD